MLVACIVCACNDRLDVNTVYAFDLQTLPVPKTVAMGDKVEIRCQLVKQGNYSGVRYFIRYFQRDGKGELCMEDGTLLTPNDLFPIKNDVFRLYYTSLSTDQQTIDIYIVDNNGQVVQKSFSFSSESNDTSQ